MFWLAGPQVFKTSFLRPQAKFMEEFLASSGTVKLFTPLCEPPFYLHHARTCTKMHMGVNVIHISLCDFTLSHSSVDGVNIRSVRLQYDTMQTIMS